MKNLLLLLLLAGCVDTQPKNDVKYCAQETWKHKQGATAQIDRCLKGKVLTDN